jgi:hypothetical protein
LTYRAHQSDELGIARTLDLWLGAMRVRRLSISLACSSKPIQRSLRMSLDISNNSSVRAVISKPFTSLLMGRLSSPEVDFLTFAAIR